MCFPFLSFPDAEYLTEFPRRALENPMRIKIEENRKDTFFMCYFINKMFRQEQSISSKQL
jgi:hypothetical protein